MPRDLTHPKAPRDSHLPDRRPWEPALTQLRELAAADLDQLVSKWLQAHGFGAARCRRRGAHHATYVAALGTHPFRVPTAVRIHQRENRLQAQHVEAFVGWLQRHGIPLGILVTTAGFTPEAITAAPALGVPRVVLLSGPQWLDELAAVDLGVAPRRLVRPVIDLKRIRSWLPARWLCRPRDDQ